MTENYRKTGYRLAVFGTAAVWIAAGMAGLLVPRLPDRQEYPTVSITLSPPEQPVQPPVIQKKEIVKPAVVQRPKPGKMSSGAAAAKKTPAGSVKAPQLVKSVEDLMAEQEAASASEKPVKWDENLFSDAAEVSSASQSENGTKTVKQVSDAEALSGKAASVSSSSSVSSGGNTASVRSQGERALSAATIAALGKIQSAEFSRPAGNGIQSTTVVDSAEGSDGALIIQMDDGSPRILIKPAKPELAVSEENARLIDSSIVVTITFRVLPQGNVPLTSIEITPSSLLQPSLQAEIKTQISLWLFAPDSSEGIARFKYRIEKK